MSDKPEGTKLTPAGVFERLLTYADRPWKAAVMIILLIIGGLGWLVYDQRGSIADAVLHKANERAELDSAAFLRDIDKLLRDTRADYGLLLEVHLGDNLIVDRVGIDRDGSRWIPSAGAQQALQPQSSMPLVVQFLSNESVCMDTSLAINDDMRTLDAKGYKRVCIVAVPPILGVSVGALVLAWMQALTPIAEGRAKITMTAAAMKFASW